MDLYRFLPEVLRLKDELARLPGTGDRGILGRFIECCESDGQTQQDLITDIVDLIDPDNVGSDYILYMALLFGEVPSQSWSEFRQREFVKQVVRNIKIKCTTSSWHRRSQEIGRGTIRIYELHKTDIEENFSYSRFPGAPYPYKSARVDIGTCSNACEISCESTCEAACESASETEILSPSEARDLLDDMGDVKPIHILVRSDGGEETLSDSTTDPSEVLSCAQYCEAVGFETQGSIASARVSDSNPTIYENLIGTQNCVSYCETSTCQVCCEYCQESGCAESCQLSCQAWCESNCQDSCEIQCQSGCEQLCESSCQSTCQSTCQLACQNACQLGCQSTCQAVCQTACETSGES